MTVSEKTDSTIVKIPADRKDAVATRIVAATHTIYHDAQRLSALLLQRLK